MLLDELDRRIVAALQIDGRASWQQLARATGASDTTVARRAHRMFAAGLVRVVASTDPLRCGEGYPVMLQVKCRVGQAPRVAAELAERPDVRFIALVTGSFDIVLELIVTSQRELARVLFNGIELVDGIQSTVTENIITHYKVAHAWSHGILDADVARTLTAERGAITERAPVPLDDRERDLVTLLAEDARLSFAALAQQLGASESMVRRRLDGLLSDGRVRFTTLVRPEFLGYDVEVFCWLGMDLRHLDEAARALAARPEVRYLAATAGYSELTCEVVLRDQNDLHRFNTEVLGGLPGLRHAEIGLELVTVKRAYAAVDSPFTVLETGSEPS